MKVKKKRQKEENPSPNDDRRALSQKIRQIKIVPCGHWIVII